MPPSAEPEWERTGCSLETMATSAPARLASIAARMPARPAPTTTTSCRSTSAPCRDVVRERVRLGAWLARTLEPCIWGHMRGSEDAARRGPRHSISCGTLREGALSSSERIGLARPRRPGPEHSGSLPGRMTDAQRAHQPGAGGPLPPLAPLRRRCLAGAVDLLWTAALVYPPARLWGGWGVVLGMLVAIAAFALQEAHDGRTLGKRLLGLRVLQLDGRPCTGLAAVLRNGF